MKKPNSMFFVALSALGLIGLPSLSHASSEFSTGRDLECTVELMAARSADLTTPGGHFTFVAKGRNPVVRFQGALTAGVRQDANNLTPADFSVASDELRLSQQISAHFPKPSISVLFQNGVLTTRVSGGGKAKVFTTQTNWQTPGGITGPEQDNLVIKDLPADGFETWVSLTCSSTFTHQRP